MYKIILNSFFGLLILFIFSCKKEINKEDYQVAFAKVFGYVKYFHPSDESVEIDWDKFAIYGVSQIENCKTEAEVIKTLEILFEPIAPSIKFSKNLDSFDSELKNLIPDNKDLFQLTYWQHKGLGLGMHDNGGAYSSVRYNKGNKDSLFDSEMKFGESITKQIVKDVFCQIPLVLFCNDEHTFPFGDEKKLKVLNDNLSKIDKKKSDNLFLRLGNVISVYNVFQHFYPYFDVVNVDWEKELRFALEASYSDNNKLDHLSTLKKFTAKLNDGHIFIGNINVKDIYTPSINWEWIEDKLIITKVFDKKYPFKKGDVVSHINDIESNKFYDSIKSYISASTLGNLNYKAQRESLKGDYGSKIKLRINGKSIVLKRYVNAYKTDEIENKTKRGYKEIEKDIWYLNLDVLEMDTIKKLFSELNKSKAIICDLRGYPNENHELINYLMEIDDTSKSWMKIPHIVYPDQENLIGFQEYNWIEMVKARKPYLGNKNIVFITDGRAISYAESYLSYIKGYRLATIVGQPTAGTNGNVNSFYLPGGYSIYWTGMKVLKHDGSQLHGIGILPDVYVKKTIEGIAEGKDEFLDKALEIARLPNNQL